MTDHHVDLRINIFCKSLYVFLLFKIFFIKSILIAELQTLFLNDIGAYAFVGTVVSVLLVSLFFRINYISSILIFASSFSISRSLYIFINGSDLVLNLFLFLSIFLSVAPRFKKPLLTESQLEIKNFFFLFCRIQLALIYLLSGFDKVTSNAWRSGDAIFSIINLDFFFNPFISIFLTKAGCLVIAWSTILFELSFAFLIWIKKFRPALLSLGAIFHVGIAFFLSLPDFGIVMILLYSLFIPYEKFVIAAKTVTSGDS